MQTTKQVTGNHPEKKISTGAISATIWKNIGTAKTGAPAEYRTITLQRRYADKDGTWKSTNSLRVNDLPKAALVLQKAYEYLVLKDGQDAAPSTGADKDEFIEEDIVM